MTRHLWDCAGEEKRQNKSASIYFYTADPSAPLHSWQGMELSLDPPNKSLFMRHGNPSLPLPIPLGLDCPSRAILSTTGGFSISLDTGWSSRCLTTTQPSSTAGDKAEKHTGPADMPHSRGQQECREWASWARQSSVYLHRDKSTDSGTERQG